MKETVKSTRRRSLGLGADSSGPRHYITGVETVLLANKIRVKSPNEEPVYAAQVEVSGLRKKRLVKLMGESSLSVGEEIKVVQITTVTGSAMSRTYHIRSTDYPLEEKPFFAKTKLKSPFRG